MRARTNPHWTAGLRMAGLAAAAALLMSCGGGGEREGDGGNVVLPDPVPPLGSVAVVAWNDLGMHCVDGKDYSVFSILPPFNNLHAQVVQRDATRGKLMADGITLTYESVADPTGSINTGSAGKTNFWNWVDKLFGTTLARDIGLTGNPTASLAPAPLAYNATQGWWEATGIPITPYDDSGTKNFYPMVKVVARNAAGQELGSTKVVLPVSDEMSCKTCHGSTSGNNAARPAAGWVNDGSDPEKDWKKNILRLHDEQHPSAVATAGQQATYPQGTLLAAALAGQPTLCAGCHASNALATPARAGIPQLTTAMHARHASVTAPGSTSTLEADPTRNACYLCHPGSVTKCLRGVMGNAVDANGKPLIDCQSCHGPMSAVGRAGRDGWLDEPTCQGCHDRSAPGAAFVRHTSVFSSGTTPRATVDRLFATNTAAPAAGKSLYRFSTGHGGLQCEACHGATHAEYPSSHDNDNLQSVALQGHTGTLRECGTCHATPPTNATNGGPHGMHVIGQAWVGKHQHVGWSAACATCHAADARGSFLSRTAAGVTVGCYNCHNGPKGDD